MFSEDITKKLSAHYLHLPWWQTWTVMLAVPVILLHLLPQILMRRLLPQFLTRCPHLAPEMPVSTSFQSSTAFLLHITHFDPLFFSTVILSV
jgi:hypothetical protein